MKPASKVGLSLYGLALLASLTGASMLLSGFLIAADWSYGVHILMVAYLLVSSFGSLGLLVATLLFWSDNRIVIKIGMVCNIETLVFSSMLAIGLLLDKHLDTAPMLIGLSRSASISVSVLTWASFPVVASVLGTFASLWRRRNAAGGSSELARSEVGASAYLRG